MNYLESAALIALHYSGIELKKIREGMEKHGSAAAFIETVEQRWPGEKVEKAVEWVDRFHIHLLSFLDPLYPKNLFQLSDFPFLLYLRGDKEVLKKPIFSIVGTRHHSLYGGENGRKIARDLAFNQLTIASGLARGIDTQAHRGALEANQAPLGAFEAGKTIAVLGSGILEIYPKENCKLAEEIIEKNGAVISEFPLDRGPLKYQFPQRNRIVAALGEGILLVESPESGGAMITMQRGWELGKKLFAVPGRIDMETYEGNHMLIKEGKAQLVEGASDILTALKISPKKQAAPQKIALTEEESFLLSHLSHQEKTIDELVLLTQYPIMKLNILLTHLVLKKVLKEFPGKIYKKIDR